MHCQVDVCGGTRPVTYYAAVLFDVLPAGFFSYDLVIFLNHSQTLHYCLVEVTSIFCILILSVCLKYIS